MIIKKLSLGLLSSALLLTTSATPALAENWTLSGSNIYKNNSANVGIGITGPTNLLTVNQSANTTPATVTTYGISLGNQALNLLTLGGDANYAYIQTWNSKPLVINSQGNNVIFNNLGVGSVGIGITPASKLHVNGNATIGYANSAPSGGLIVSGDVGLGINAPTAKLDVGGSVRHNAYGSGDIWLPFTDGNTYLRSPINKVTNTILAENGNWSINNVGNAHFLGNVGIRTSAPGATLDVRRGTASEGTAVFYGTTYGSYFNFSTPEDTYIRGGKNLSKVYVNDNHAGNVILASGGGKVGIGTTTPAEQFTVTGRIKMDTWLSDGTTAIYKSSSGTFGLLASDLRLKTNITPIGDSLAKIDGITGVLFNWKTDPEGAKKTVGVIAQDVQKVLPEAVFSFKNEKGEELYGVHYEKLTALLIQGVKEQQQQIDELRKEIEELKKSR